MNGWGKFATLASLAPRKPEEFLWRMVHMVECRVDAWRPHPATYEPTPFEEIVQRVGAHLPHAISTADLEPVDAAVMARKRMLQEDGPLDRTHCGGEGLVQCAYLLTRGLRPENVVETGVAYGTTSAYVLRGLADNGAGHLTSIDLPPLGDEEGAWIGSLVAKELRDRWTLERGASRALLPRALRARAPIDLFIHDSLHTYMTMKWEFALAWRHLRPGGILLSDDVFFNAAFRDFVRENETAFDVVGDGFGIAVKPS